MSATERRTRTLQKRFQTEDQNARISAIRLLLSTREGRSFLWLFLSDCHVFQQPFASNALNTAFNCGELNVGQVLLAQILEADPDAFSVLMKESKENAERRSSELAGTHTDSDTDTGADFD